jgi:hypothetical protein
MARTHYVGHARQRYKMVPVIDPETGEQKVITTARKTRAKGSRPGRPVVQRLTRPDLTRPLPDEKCGRCGAAIKPGMPYKWIAPKSGPYGGRRMVRCASCPNWHVWEYSSSLSARLAEISHAFSTAVRSAESAEDVESALEDAAGSIEEIADEKDESADNMQEGFGGNETQPVMDLRDIAEQLRTWADEVRNADVPELPDPEAIECEPCNGTGKVVKLYDDSPLEPWRPGSYAEGVVRKCGECHGSGEITPDEPAEHQMDDWHDEVEASVTIVDESPV